MKTEHMKSKVFKNDEVLILEREINSWLEGNQDINVVDTAVADNQFIILYNKMKTVNKLDEAIVQAKNIKNSIKEVHGDTVGADLMENKPIIGKGIHAPHITDYYDKKDEQ